jgi:hypothetical protein
MVNPDVLVEIDGHDVPGRAAVDTVADAVSVRIDLLPAAAR